jgi:aminopeptidase N
MTKNFNTLNYWFSINTVNPSEKIDYRLPKHLMPYNYDVYIKAQFDTIIGNSFPYDGEVTISFTCAQNTNSLIFHINKLLINNSTLSVKGITDTSFPEIKAFNWINDYERQFFVANLAQEFKASHNYSVFIKFTGYLTDDNAGFYRSSYLDNNQQKRWLLTSQMESTDARKSFPCFDEPAMKAIFKIKVEHKPYYNANSNMPIASIQTQ